MQARPAKPSEREELKIRILRSSEPGDRETIAPQTAPPVRATVPVAAEARPHPSQASAAAESPRRRLLTFDRVFWTVCAVALYVGFTQPTRLYITPRRGLGYALGIIGGSLMLLLLVYSLRKRWSWLGFLGSTPWWFQFHMVLGVLGPLCILYHANFSTGATNSNMALFSMLAVAGSGFVGRYFYAHVHSGLYGRKLELGELRAGAERLRTLSSGAAAFVPELIARIERAEQQVLEAGPHLPLLVGVRPVVAAIHSGWARWRLRSYLRQALRRGARHSPAVAAERRRLRLAALGYIDRRLLATKRVAQFAGYERLFSLWHALHIQLIFMLVAAALVHVIAVNVY
ncbi:MAG: pyridine nucleotide-disulfide oxidoreductase [Proteobacteria bacterium]|nr:pyridine nucleotide-disulfide oxidoreductase [Pseudomonadota bacterium]